MAYLNHAGTSWPKPPAVRAAVAETLDAPAATWGERFTADRRAVAAAFGVADEQRLLLTPGCTSALATAIADLPWTRGDRVLTSGLEHHALQRPVAKLAALGVEAVVAPRTVAEPVVLDAVEAELRRGDVRLVALTAACNVTGELLPVSRVWSSWRTRTARCAWSTRRRSRAGSRSTSASFGVDLLAFAGHKGLQAPWGIGGLYVAPQVELQVVGAACELPAAGAAPAPCAPMPGYCDTGSVDRCALAGLVAGLRWLDERPDRLERARGRVERVARLAEELGFALHGPRDPEGRLPTLALTHPTRSSAELGRAFAERGVLVASGLMCAPLAHETLGTAPGGVVRISAGPATSDGDVERTLDALRALLAARA